MAEVDVAMRERSSKTPAADTSAASTSSTKPTIATRIISVIIAVVGVAGVVLLLLPTIAGWFSQAMFSNEIRDLSQTAREIEPESRAQALAAAREYNENLAGQVSVAEGENKPQIQGAAADESYDGLLAADSRGLMARLEVPAINADLPIYHGTSDATLQQGVGHLQGTALPVGGVSTHSVLTAHRGLAKAELFTKLDRVEVGDEFSIEVFGEALTYEVTNTVVVEPTETTSLFPHSGRDLVTLVTCTPLGVNSHRILVTGERTADASESGPETVGIDPLVPGFPWWSLGVAGSLVAAGFFVRRVWGRLR